MTEEIPVPEGLTLVGSMTRSGWRGEPETEIILDAALSAEDVREAYRQQMTAVGWFERQRPGPRGGFSPGPRRGRLMLCKSERGPSLMVTADDRPGEPTAVRANRGPLTAATRPAFLTDTTGRNSTET